jgi:hypothetical protein
MPRQRERVRITNQFRDRRGMVYELSCDGVGVAISIWPSIDEKTAWSAEMTAKRLPRPPAVCVTGASREAAVRALGDAWAEADPAGEPPLLDWEAIRAALALVRAI